MLVVFEYIDPLSNDVAKPHARSIVLSDVSGLLLGKPPFSGRKPSGTTMIRSIRTRVSTPSGEFGQMASSYNWFCFAIWR